MEEIILLYIYCTISQNFQPHGNQKIVVTQIITIFFMAIVTGYSGDQKGHKWSVPDRSIPG